jgi:uncharacterized protein (TIGR02145 family)
VGSGLWSIISGTAGILADPANPATTFTATPCETYILRWTVSTACYENYDEIMVSFDDASATVNAGADITICENQAPFLQATSQNYQSLLWETSGTGTFNNPEILNPAYLPSDEDKENGEVTLMLTAWPPSPCGDPASDQLVLTIQQFAGADAGEDATICENQNVSLSGAVSNNSGVLWITQGDGTFGDPSSLLTYYTPGVQDIQNNGTVLSLIALPIAPCEIAASKDVAIEIQKLPSVVTFGPNTDFFCKTDNYLQLNALIQEYTTISWSTSGDGFFNSNTDPTTRYYPGDNDKAYGEFTLMITANPKQYCSVAITESKTVYIVDNPEVDILTTSNQLVCASPPFPVEAVASAYDEIEWSTDGDGIFNNQNALITDYTPGTGDLSGGTSIKLTLSAAPIAPCVVAAVDHIFVNFQNSPFAQAGNDAAICEGQTYQLSGSAEHFSSIQWQTDGDGNFNQTNIPNPVYTPGTADITSESVILTLTAQPISPCTVFASDEMTLDIQQLATANAGNDAEICENSTHTLSGQAQHYASVVWTTSGSGSFSNAYILNPVYTPSGNDIAVGSVVLTLTAQPQSPCVIAASDTKTLNIQQPSTANAGADADICENDIFTLNGQAQNYTYVQWTSSGNGSFSNANILNPLYAPGTTDINSGAAVLTLTAASISPCTIFASDEMTLGIQQLSTANAGNDAVICENKTHTLSGQAQHYASVVWTTSGSGTFSNVNILNPVYTPSNNDITTGAVILTLTAQPQSPCVVAASDTKTLNMQQIASANAGNNAEVCANELYTLNGQAQNFTSVLWTTSGTGSFDNAFILNPEYTPGQSDISNGSVILTLTAEPLTPCTVATSDEMTLSFLPVPFVNAGQDQEDLPGTTATLQGNNPTGSANGLWTIAGGQGGNVAQPSNPQSVFTGIAGETYLLQWSITGQNGCVNGDFVIISFIPNPNACPGTPTVTDADGNVYNTVLIGNQCWMAENLKATKDAAGNSITRYCYNDSSIYCNLYGGIYSWSTVMNGSSGSNSNPSGVQGICPTGWHVPSDAEWTQLVDHVVSQGYPNSNVTNGAGNALKSCRQVNSPLIATCNTNEHPRWDQNDENYGTDVFGFSALPSGRWPAYGLLGVSAHFFTSTGVPNNNYARVFRNDYGEIKTNIYAVGWAFSLRCIRD